MTLKLVPVAPDADPGQLADELAPAFGGDPAGAREVLNQTVDLLTRDPRSDPWGSYFAYDGEAPVGMCAFKTAHAGETIDPEDGLVWRWERRCGA